MQTSLNYQPLPHLHGFHTSTARERMLYGGFGSGKTYALCADAIGLGLRQPGSEIAMIRKTAPELKHTTEPVFFDVLGAELYGASKITRSGGRVETVLLPNGTRFLFLQMDDWRKHRSLNLTALYWDELSEIDKESYEGMLGRLRRRRPTAEAQRRGYTDELTRRVSAAASNPAGHDWAWKRFVNQPRDHHKYWVSSSLDNPFLPMDYLEALLQMPESWVRRYVLCSFDDFGGAIYPEWGWSTHRIDMPAMTAATPILMGLDPGTRHPTAALWVAVIGQRMVAVHEEMSPDWDVDKWASTFRRAEANLPSSSDAPPRVTWRVADPNSVHVRDRGTMLSLHAQYRQRGFLFHDGPSRHQDRIPMLGQLVKQRRFLCTDATPRFFQQMQDYKWEQLTTAMRTRLGEHAEAYGPEKPVKVDEDLVDCAQYISSRWVRPPKVRHTHQDPRKSAWALESEEIQALLKGHIQRNNERRYTPSDDAIAAV